jgi:hypothetical protein
MNILAGVGWSNGRQSDAASRAREHHVLTNWGEYLSGSSISPKLRLQVMVGPEWQTD